MSEQHLEISDDSDDSNGESHVDPLFLDKTSKIRIANATNKPILVRVTENELHMKDLSLGGNVGVNVKGLIEVNGETKISWERTLRDAGFGTIGPISYLTFKVCWYRGKIFVSLFEECDGKFIQKYDNYSPPKSKPLLYTNTGLVPSEKKDPFVPIITPGQAALIAKADPKLHVAGSTAYKSAVSPTGDIECWRTNQQDDNKSKK